MSNNNENNSKQEGAHELDTALGKLSAALVEAKPLSDKLDLITKSLSEITNADGTSIWLIEDNEIIRCKAGTGIYKKILNKYYKLDEDGVTPNIARTGEAVLSNKYNEHKMNNPKHVGKFDNILFEKEGERCESFMQVPLKIGDEIIGVVKADSIKPNFFSKKK